MNFEIASTELAQDCGMVQLIRNEKYPPFNSLIHVKSVIVEVITEIKAK